MMLFAYHFVMSAAFLGKVYDRFMIFGYFVAVDDIVLALCTPGGSR